MIERLISWSGENRFLVFSGILFLSLLGLWSLRRTPLDAIPDLTDPQVILHTEWMGRSPELVEEQITYPIATKLLSAPRVQAVRGYSMFGNSFVYVIFEEGTDLYWARSRVVEYLSQIEKDLPEGVTPTLGPDATGLGWVFQYALVDTTGKHDLSRLRSFNDWYLRYALQSVPGVAEVAPIGGYVKEYQVILDPTRLASYGIPVDQVMRAIRMSNRDVGGRNFEWAGREVIVRGLGYIRSLEDLAPIAVGRAPDGTPVYLKDVARIQLGPAPRRGTADLDGQGEVVGGVVIMRQGENALRVIQRVKAKLKEIQNTLPEGVGVVVTYDRSELIQRAIRVLLRALLEESVIVSVVTVLFLWAFRSALVAILLLPVAILLSFIPMAALRVTANIMSLGGIAIALGAMVDAAVVMIENAHKLLERAQEEGGGKPLPATQRFQVILEAARQVGRPLFFSLLIITISFLPIFALEAQEGRLFKPLAFTKTFAMFFAAFLSITLAPALLTMIVGRVRPESENPLNRFLVRVYRPVALKVLRYPWRTVLVAVAVFLLSLPLFRKIGSEFMPPLEEGSILYMPTTLPGISITEARRILQIQDSVLKSFPEVARVFGKAGRAETATDPAPLSMIETTILLKPQREWRKGMTFEKLIEEMDQALRIPGFPNIWTQPIKNRVDMVSTGIRTPVGVKLYGPSVDTLQQLALQVEGHMKMMPEVRSAVSQRLLEGTYLDVQVKREILARYGLTLEDVNRTLEMSLGGLMGLPIIEGRERYRLIVRYPRELRDDVDKIRRLPVLTGVHPGPDGRLPWIPLSAVAEIEMKQGPNLILSEEAMPVIYVFVDVKTDDLGGFVRRAKSMLEANMTLPPGYRMVFSGQYEYMERASRKFQMIIPITLLTVFMLLFLNFRHPVPSLLVMLTLPFAMVGSLWLLFLLRYNFSVAVWVGVIALLGVAAEIGVVLLIFLQEAYEHARHAQRLKTRADLRRAVVEGAVERVRPVMMTVSALLFGLLPLMWGHGAGASIMKRIAAPMVGGILSSAAMTMLVLPVLYYLWKRRGLPEDL